MREWGMRERKRWEMKCSPKCIPGIRSFTSLSFPSNDSFCREFRKKKKSHGVWKWGDVIFIVSLCSLQTYRWHLHSFPFSWLNRFFGYTSSLIPLLNIVYQWMSDALEDQDEPAVCLNHNHHLFLFISFFSFTPLTHSNWSLFHGRVGEISLSAHTMTAVTSPGR